jgi:tetratricopeptide (TPR) repeat protein
MQSMSKTWAGPVGEAAKQFSASGLRTTRTAKTMSMSTTTTTTRGGASKSKRRGSTKVGGGRNMEEDPAVAERRRVEMMDRVVVLDAAHAELRRQGKVLESLEHLEKSLFLRRECWGPESTEVDRATQVFISSCNACSMVCLQAGNYKLCAELLRKADVLTGPKGYIKSKWIRRRLKCLTLNNLGCFYRRMGKLHSALRSLEESLKLEIAAVGDVQSAQDEAQQEEHGGGDALDGEPMSRDAALRDVATSHLNISAVLSEMARHDASLQHAQCSVEIMRVRGFPERGLEDGGDVAELETFAIANHNMAAEYEHLSMYEEGASAYASAVQAAEQVWGYTHGKTLNMRRAQEECAKLIKVAKP